jgi:hypothetical protein
MFAADTAGVVLTDAFAEGAATGALALAAGGVTASTCKLRKLRVRGERNCSII